MFGWRGEGGEKEEECLQKYGLCVKNGHNSFTLQLKKGQPNMSKIKIKPLRDNVIIEPVMPEETTESGIVIPDSVDKDKPEQGVVVAVGEGRVAQDGTRVAMEVKPGDAVLFSKYGLTKIVHQDKEYLVGKEDEILAVIEE